MKYDVQEIAKSTAHRCAEIADDMDDSGGAIGRAIRREFGLESPESSRQRTILLLTEMVKFLEEYPQWAGVGPRIGHFALLERAKALIADIEREG